MKITLVRSISDEGDFLTGLSGNLFRGLSGVDADSPLFGDGYWKMVLTMMFVAPW